MTTSQSEHQILTQFLLSRSSLTDILTLPQFTDLFPRDKRQNPQIKLLYRELQLDRNRTCKRVKNNIRTEVELGTEQRRQLARERSRANGEDARPEEMDGIELYGSPGRGDRVRLKELVEAMEMAAEELEQEQQTRERECEEMLEYVKTVVDDLSDLRYGKLANPGTEMQVVHQLENLTRVCERKLKPEGE